MSGSLYVFKKKKKFGTVPGGEDVRMVTPPVWYVLHTLQSERRQVPVGTQFCIVWVGETKFQEKWKPWKIRPHKIFTVEAPLGPWREL